MSQFSGYNYICELKAESLYVDDAKKRQIEAGGDRKSEEYQKSHISNLIEPIEPEPKTTTQSKAAEQAGVSTGALQCT